MTTSLKSSNLWQSTMNYAQNLTFSATEGVRLRKTICIKFLPFEKSVTTIQ